MHAILAGAATTTPPLPVDTDDGVLSAMAEDFTDGEDEEEEEEDDDELGESKQLSPTARIFFTTLTEIPSQPNEAGERTSGIIPPHSLSVREKEKQSKRECKEVEKEREKILTGFTVAAVLVCIRKKKRSTCDTIETNK
ncbi:hypothetical protein UY3_11885 [Chelonia mydas]|uniref:Uncharacterized protein n=1 Tax=Chelonia mydas TaxID=8469 RepID=M7BS98_CHEMY|nr:hypothetical protein UY3_11885 [Chelonia mydas]